MTDAGLRHIAGLTQLEGLMLQFTGMTDAGMEHLEGMPRLRSLDIRGTKVGAKRADEFRSAHPRCKVWH